MISGAHSSGIVAVATPAICARRSGVSRRNRLFFVHVRLLGSTRDVGTKRRRQQQRLAAIGRSSATPPTFTNFQAGPWMFSSLVLAVGIGARFVHTSAR